MSVSDAERALAALAAAALQPQPGVGVPPSAAAGGAGGAGGAVGGAGAGAGPGVTITLTDGGAAGVARGRAVGENTFFSHVFSLFSFCPVPSLIFLSTLRSAWRGLTRRTREGACVSRLVFAALILAFAIRYDAIRYDSPSGRLADWAGRRNEERTAAFVFCFLRPGRVRMASSSSDV